MKLSGYILAALFGLTCITSLAGQPDSVLLETCSTYYNTAYLEMADMLDGKQPLSLKRAVFLHEWAYLDGNLDYDWFCGKIEEMATYLKAFIALNNLEQYKTGGNFALFDFFTQPRSGNGGKPFIYDLDDFNGDDDYTNIFVSKLMRTHSGQCRSLPLLYKILANEIGAEAYIAYTPNHSFIRHPDETDPSKWVNVELTNHSMPREVFIIESMGITERAIQTGIYMKPCSDREITIQLMWELAYGYLHKYGTNPEDMFLPVCLNRVLEYDPDNLGALMTMNNCIAIEYTAYIEYLKSMGITVHDETSWNLHSQLQAIGKKIADLGYVDMTKEQYEEWVRSMEEEKTRRKQNGE